MSPRAHRYVTIFGSCATADAFRYDGWPTFVDEGIRIYDYVSRTGFSSLATEPLKPDEWALPLPPDAQDDPSANWGYQMARGEIDKTHLRRLMRAIRKSDALVFDVVGMFTFPTLTTADGRALMGSWELEQFFEIRPSLTRRWLWEQPYEPLRDTALAFLRAAREARPDLRIAMHLAPLCTNDGVLFKPEEAVLNDHIEDYRVFAARLAKDCAQALDVVTLAGASEAARARPDHPYGRYPFHYQLDYYVSFRRTVKSWLGLPPDTELRPE